MFFGGWSYQLRDLVQKQISWTISEFRRVSSEHFTQHNDGNFTELYLDDSTNVIRFYVRRWLATYTLIIEVKKKPHYGIPSSRRLIISSREPLSRDKDRIIETVKATVSYALNREW